MINFSPNRVEHEKCFITSGPGVTFQESLDNSHFPDNVSHDIHIDLAWDGNMNSVKILGC